MKTLKTILIAATMISASVVSNVSAQQAAQPSQHQWKVAKGDSVMIKRECQEYLTGERPSVWVWDKVHAVYQLGTKRFPEGVLLMNINSWICEECLIRVNAEEEQPAEEPKAEEPKAKEPAPAPKPVAEEPKAEEPAPVVEEPKAEEPAAVEEETPEAELPQAETIMTPQNFKHNYDRFTIGLRGGASSLMHHAENGKWLCGGDVVLDLQYAHYWAKDGRPVDLGIIAGLGIGYQQSGLTTNDSTSFPRPVNGYNVNYSVVAKDIKETDHQLQLEIPVLFSLIADNGVFFNFGPKLMLPLYTPYKQTVNQDDTHISAYFEETGVTMIDNVVTGKYEGQQPTEKNGIQFNMNLMLTAELGYEWVLKSGNSFGLGAYANYGWNLSYKNTPNAEGLFNLTAPTNSNKAHLDVLSATHAYADKLSFFDAGIKVAYHFNFPKKKQFKDSKLF